MVWSVHATPQYRKFSQPLPGQFFPISTLNIIPLNHSITTKLPHGNADDDRYDGSTPLSCKTLKLLSGLFFLFSLSSSLLRSSVVRSSYSVEGGVVVVVVVALALPRPVLLPSTSPLPPFPPFLLLLLSPIRPIITNTVVFFLIRSAQPPPLLSLSHRMRLVLPERIRLD